MKRKLQSIRNIGIIAHIDAGKTTLTEHMLFCAGSTHRVGKVDDGTTITDEDPEEGERGITIYSACVTFPWKNSIINLLDTPGHVDFTAEVERCLRVLDGAVVVFSAREGVEAQSETVWRQANKYRVPRLVFVNKLDREGADFTAVLNEIKTRLVDMHGKSACPVVIQIPVGVGPAHAKDPFRGVIDLVKMKMIEYDAATDGKQFTESDIPPELRDEAELWRESLLESLYGFSDEMMKLAMQEEEIPEELIHSVLREATLAQQLQPVLCGSALRGIGVQPVLDSVDRYLPTPADIPPVKGFDPNDAESVEERRPDPEEPFCGLVFKVIPEKTGDNYWVRVYSGELKSNSRVLNPDKGVKENVSQLWHIHALRKEPKGKIDKVEAGDIVCIIGPRRSITGDTLCDPKHPVLLETIQFPETVISMAIEPESTTDRKKLAETLDMLKRQDPTFLAVDNEETGQTLISGMGELHLDVIRHRLLRDFKLNVKVHKPRVNYRETVASAVEVVGECHRQIAGQQLFGRVKIRMEPVDDAAVSVVKQIEDEGSLPLALVAATMEELKSLAEGGGPIGSFPLTKLRVTFLAAEAREEGSTEAAFRIAAGNAFEKALNEAGPVLLEPVMKVEIFTPEEYLGDFIGDFQQRRATIARTEHRGEMSVIEAHAPLAELFGYSNAQRSLSQGRAGCSIEPLEYAPAPPEVAEAFAF